MPGGDLKPPGHYNDFLTEKSRDLKLVNML
jgi:hypothetical protein